MVNMGGVKKLMVWVMLPIWPARYWVRIELGALAVAQYDRAERFAHAPRDALLADSVHPAITRLCLWFHRAMDNGGALGGRCLAVAIGLVHGRSAKSFSGAAGRCAGLLVLILACVSHHFATEQEKIPAHWPGAVVANDRPLPAVLVLSLLRALPKASFYCVVTNWHDRGAVHALWATLNVASLHLRCCGRLPIHLACAVESVSWSGYATEFFLLAVQQRFALWWTCICFLTGWRRL